MVCALQGRTADLRFGRSRVHAWGLFARQDIEPETFIIEYVGQVSSRGSRRCAAQLRCPRCVKQQHERCPWHICNNMHRPRREQSCHVQLFTEKLSALMLQQRLCPLHLFAAMCAALLLALCTEQAVKPHCLASAARIAGPQLELSHFSSSVQLIRVSLLDTRERQYDREGLGSSYLFRIDMEWAVDATKKVALRCPALQRPWHVFQN